MSNLAMAAHHHKHHHGGGAKANASSSLLHHLEDKVSSLVAVAHGSQGPDAQHVLFIGLALAAVLLILGWRKVRRT